MILQVLGVIPWDSHGDLLYLPWKSPVRRRLLDYISHWLISISTGFHRQPPAALGGVFQERDRKPDVNFMSIYICDFFLLFIYVFIHLFIYLFIYLFMYLFILYSSIPSIYLFIYLFIYLSTYLFIYEFTLYLHMLLYIFTYMHEKCITHFYIYSILTHVAPTGPRSPIHRFASLAPSRNVAA